ncbi:MAG TPA: rod shape-determining protein RodA [Candidatus Moranbacteria bacterium]|nr:rod shape-determining protein RodA [Candidatus Moranbacteria bacterium]
MFNKLLKLDWILILASLLLLTVGLLALYSISVSGKTENGMNIFDRQVIFAIIGIIAMFSLSFIDYRYFRSHSKLVYFSMLIILTSVLVLGTISRGTVGWLTVGSFHIQPVELAKVLLILSLASFITKSKTVLSENLRIIVAVFLSGIAIFLVLQQPDFGSALVLMSILAVMILLSGIEWKYLIGIILIGIVVVIVGWFFLADYQKDRLINFVNPENDPQGSGYNVIQSVIAVGSGGLTGKGLGHGSQSQLNFLPESHTDFIFAVIVEEFGVLGAGIVLSLLTVIFYRMKKIAEIATDNFGYLIVVGSMAMFFIQVLINIGMNMGIMPVTGIPLIFLSYGGSSLISVFITIGIVNNIFVIGKKSVETKIKTEDNF